MAYQVYLPHKLRKEPSAWERFKGAAAEGLASAMVALPVGLARQAIKTGFEKGGSLWRGMQPESELDTYAKQQALELEAGRLANEATMQGTAEASARTAEAKVRTAALEAGAPIDRAYKQAMTEDIRAGRATAERGLDISETGQQLGFSTDRARLALDEERLGLTREQWEYEKERQKLKDAARGGTDEYKVLDAYMQKVSESQSRVAALDEKAKVLRNVPNEDRDETWAIVYKETQRALEVERRNLAGREEIAKKRAPKAYALYKQGYDKPLEGGGEPYATVESESPKWEPKPTFLQRFSNSAADALGRNVAGRGRDAQLSPEVRALLSARNRLVEQANDLDLNKEYNPQYARDIAAKKKEIERVDDYLMRAGWTYPLGE
jgi:hypothetical protein